MGQVVGPDRGAGVSGLEVDGDADVAGRQVDGGGVGGGGGLAADPDAVHRDVEVGRVEGGAGRPDAGQDPTPVGVVAVDRGLEQVAARDRAADLDGVVLGRGVQDRDRDLVVGTLGVG